MNIDHLPLMYNTPLYEPLWTDPDDPEHEPHPSPQSSRNTCTAANIGSPDKAKVNGPHSLLARERMRLQQQENLKAADSIKYTFVTPSPKKRKTHLRQTKLKLPLTSTTATTNAAKRLRTETSYSTNVFSIERGTSPYGELPSTPFSPLTKLSNYKPLPDEETPLTNSYEYDDRLFNTPERLTSTRSSLSSVNRNRKQIVTIARNKRPVNIHTPLPPRYLRGPKTSPEKKRAHFVTFGINSTNFKRQFSFSPAVTPSAIKSSAPLAPKSIKSFLPASKLTNSKLGFKCVKRIHLSNDSK